MSSDFVPAIKRIQDAQLDITGKPLIASGDKNFYGANQIVPRTQEHIEEIIKCKNDMFYFIQNYCYIVSMDKGEHIVELWDYQKNMLNHMEFNRFSILMLSRQLGKSTIVTLYILWKIIFNNNFSVLMVSHTDDNAMEIFYKRLLVTYRLLPKFLKPTYVEFNKHALTLTTRSQILSHQIGPSVGRGNTYNLVFADELAFYDTKIWNEWYATMYPTITSALKVQTKIIITSTPRGLNQFYDLWTGAIRKENMFKPFLALWTEKPWPSKEAMDRFKEETIKNFGAGGISRWNQEFECQFLSSSDNLFSSKALVQIEPITPIRTLNEGKLKIYKEPKKDHQYILVCDIGEGVGGDFTVMNMIDVSVKPFEQVAIFRDNNTPLILIDTIIESFSKLYEDAETVIEYNSIGAYICNKLWNENEFENLFYDFKHELPGLRTTQSSKRTGVTKLKEYIENGMIIINDADTLREFSNFVQVGVSYNGISTDDITMTFVIFAYFTSLEHFIENYNTSWINKFYDKQFTNIKKEINDGEEDDEINEEDLEGFNIYSNIEDDEDNRYQDIEQIYSYDDLKYANRIRNNNLL